MQPAQSGLAIVPEAIAAWRPQAEQAARRRWQAGQHGCPVTREIPHGAAWPQTEQVRTGSEGQREQSGPSAVRRFDRAAATAACRLPAAGPYHPGTTTRPGMCN